MGRGGVGAQRVAKDWAGERLERHAELVRAPGRRLEQEAPQGGHAGVPAAHATREEPSPVTDGVKRHPTITAEHPPKQDAAQLREKAKALTQSWLRKPRWER